MSESHEKYKIFKDKEAKAKRYKSPERELEAQIAKREYKELKREEEEDNRRTERLFNYGD